MENILYVIIAAIIVGLLLRKLLVKFESRKRVVKSSNDQKTESIWTTFVICILFLCGAAGAVGTAYIIYKVKKQFKESNNPVHHDS